MNMKPGKMDYANPNQIHLFEKSHEEKDKEERKLIGEKYNIYGDARNRMVKINNQWSLDGQTVEQHQNMLNNIYEKDEDRFKN